MKTVLFLRHAKSDWGEPNLTDFDRPLAKRGLENAPRMGTMLALFNCIPDQILSSPARRAQQTAELVAKACGYHHEIQWRESFYEGGSPDLISALQGLPQEIGCVLLIGHNPVMEETVARLCAASPAKRGEIGEANLTIKIPTAGLVCLNFYIEEWADLGPGEGELQWFLIPKLVKALQQKEDKR